MVFDPYHKWLGIPPAEQPPNDYRLLGAPLFESDPDVIANAADRQFMILRTVQAGKHQAESQRLMNEVAAARIRLLNPQKKAEYDQQLRAQLAQAAPQPIASAVPTAHPIGAPNGGAAPFPAASPHPTGTPGSVGLVEEMSASLPTRPIAKRGRRKKSWIPAVAVLGVVLAIAGSAGAYWFFVQKSELPPLEIAPNEQIAEYADGANGESVETAGTDSAASDGQSGEASPQDAPTNPASPPQGSSTASDDQANANQTTAASAANDRDESPRQATVASAAPSPRGSPSAQPPVNAVVGGSSTNGAASSQPSSSSAPGSSPSKAKASPQAPPEPKKLTPPDDETLAKARQQVRDIFAARFDEAQSPKQQVELAETLLDEAEQLQGDASGRYALLIEALEQTIAAGYYPKALEIVDRLSSEWEVDRLRFLGRALAAAVRSPHAATMRGDLVDAALKLAEEAIQQHRFDGAEAVANMADDLATRLRDVELRKATRRMLERTKRLRRDWEKVAAAQKALEENPDDPEANLIVGKYLALEKADFTAGLRHLARASDETLRPLAQRDVDEQARSGNDRAEEQVALADAWSEFAESNPEWAGFLARAHHWYAQAAPQATGLLKTKAERRRDELAEHEEVQRVLALSSGAGVGEPAGPVDILLQPLNTITGHGDTVNRVAFSPQGDLIATASDDNTARIWDLKKSRLHFVISSHKNDVTALSWSPDGKVLATGSRDKTIQLWDTAKGRPLRLIPAHDVGMGVTDVAFLPTGRSLVSCGYSDPPRLWDARTGALLGELRNASTYLHDVDVTPDGRVLTATSDPDAAVLWGADGQAVHTFPHFNYVQFAVPSPDGKRVATGGTANPTRIWSLEDGQQIAELPGSYAASAAWSPDGRVLILGNISGSLLAYDASEWAQRHTTPRLSQSVSQRVTSVSFSPDGKMLAMCAGDSVVRLWQVEVTPRAASDNGPPPTLGGRPVTGSNNAPPNGNAVIVAPRTNPPVGASSTNAPSVPTGRNGRAIEHRGSNGERARFLATLEGALGHAQSEPPTTALAFSSDGTLLLSGSANGQIKIWEARAGVHVRSVHHQSDAITAIIVNPKGNQIASADRSGAYCLWKLPNGAMESKSSDPNYTFGPLAFLPDGSLLVARSDGIIQRSGNPGVFRKHTGAITGLGVAPDGQTFYSSGKDGLVLEWNVADAAVAPRVVFQQNEPVDDLIVSPKGDLAIVVSLAREEFKTLRLADRVVTSSHRIDGPIPPPIVFAADGATVFAGLERGSVMVRDTASLKFRFWPHVFPATVHRLAVSPDGTRLAAASADGELCLWELTLPPLNP